MTGLSRRLRGLRPSFGVSLVATFVLTAVVVGTGQYVFGAWKLGAGVLERALAGHQGDAQVMQDMYGDNPQDPVRALAEVLTHIEHRPGGLAAALVGADGEVLATGHTYTGARAVHGDEGHGEPMQGEASHGDPMEGQGTHSGQASPYHAEFAVGQPLSEGDRRLVHQVLATEEALAELGRDAREGTISYVAPLELDGVAHVVYVLADADVLDGQLADLRSILLLGLAAAVLLGGPVFHLLGGRRLVRTHRRHVDHAVRDPLTGLGNHRAYQDAVRQQLELARRHDQPLTLALLDLDGFKMVNDTSGHRRGDEVLAEVAQVLEDGRAGDLAFRVGGDEFAVLLPQTGVTGARAACERLRDRIVTRVPEIGASIGLAGLAGDNDEAEALWDRADAAMYQGKRRGRNHVVAFHELDENDPDLALTHAAALRALLDAGEMGVVFQPIFALTDREVMGYEALARPPELSGFDGPGQLFETAERLGSVPELDALCRRAVLAASTDLPKGATLYLNISPAALDNELLDWVELRQQVIEVGLRPQQVTIELTERTRIPASVLEREVRSARAMGFRVALDDIGTGWAGFGSLAALRPDIAKIDRSIVVRAPHDEHARAVLAAVATYAAMTGAVVIAEGVEDEDTLEHLQGLGDRIRGVQGFLLGLPRSLRPLASDSDDLGTVPGHQVAPH